MMKKIATTIALSALFMASVIDDANASILTRNNKVTLAQLQGTFGTDAAGGSFPSYKNSTHVLYDNLVAARKVFESTAKTYKLQKDATVKVFVELVGKIEKALIDIYQSEKDSKLIDKASTAKNYYDQNSGAYALVRGKLGAALQPFEASFKGLAVPEPVGSITGDIASAAKDVFDIITELKGQMVDETAQTPQPQTTVIVVPANTAASSSSSSDGNWMFDNPQATTAQPAQNSTVVVQPQATTAQAATTQVTTTTVAAPAVQTPTVTQPVVVQPVAAPVVSSRGKGRKG